MYELHDIYIGRKSAMFPQSKWANPYTIGKDGTREEVIAKYEDYVRKNPILMQSLEELRGKVLGCWCKNPKYPDTPCHGDVLVRLLKETEHETPRVLPEANQSD